MKRIKIKRYRKIKITLIISLIISSFMLSTRAFNHYMEPQLLAIAKQHTGFAINNIVKEVLSDMDYDSKELINVNTNSNGEITSIDYNSSKLNQLLYSALNTIDESLQAAQDGKKDPITKDVFYEDGILYETPLGYFSHIFFLYDKGPKIKVRMKVLNDVTGDIKTVSEPYGINSTMIKILLVVRVDAQVLTFVSKTEMNNICEIPLVLQVVNGKVPSYSPFNSQVNGR